VWHPSKSGYYYGIFWSGMPDLNFNNPEVTAEMLKVSRFWLQDVGVDGFRLDGARHLIEDGKTQENTEGTHTWWEGFRKEYKAINPQSFTVGEVWTTNYAVVEYVRGDEFDLAFNFDLASSVVKNVNGRSAKPIADGLRLSEKLLGGSNYATFLTNHDMNRVMNELGGSFEKARSAATILLTAPGVPFIYYGEEIGMSGKKPDELIRTPMQWSGEKNAGFTNGSPWESVNRDAKDIHVAAQEADPASLLNHYRALVHLRSQFASLRVGELFPVETGSDILLAFLRFYQNAAGEKEATLVLVNLGEKPLEKYQLDLKSGPLSGDYRAVVLLSAGDFGGAPALAGFTANAQGGFTDYVPSVSLPPDSSLVFQLLP
jgi:glycosidase